MKVTYFFQDLKFRVGRVFSDKRVVLELCDLERLDYRIFSGEEIFTFSKFNPIPKYLHQPIEDMLGMNYIPFAEGLLQHSSARMSLLLIDGIPASVSWLRAGSAIPSWVVPLSPTDQVFSRGFTVPAFRGRGCYGRVITAGFESVSDKSCRFLTDCHIYNVASINNFRRLGFDVISQGYVG